VDLNYRRISFSLVAEHPAPIGVVQFYGGQFFGQLPATWYSYLLEALYREGYALIVTPFRFGFNHVAIAGTLLYERDVVRRTVPSMANLTHFWVGHSLGCKFITLLEAYTDPLNGAFTPPGVTAANAARQGILDEPALLMAPDIGDTSATLPVPILPQILDSLNLGVQPSRADTQKLIREDDLFGLTSLISFSNDNIAGSVDQSPEKSDVAWFVKELESRVGGDRRFYHREIAGDHLTPLGIQVADLVLEANLRKPIVPAEPLAEMEQTAIEMLSNLTERRKTAIARRAQRQA
jgi:hypothetical protein